MTTKEILQRYEETKKRIRRSTPLPLNESPTVKEKRISELLEDFTKFCKYYFPEYFDPEEGGAEFAWFHKRAAKEIIENPNIFAVLEWPREHAKSVFGDIFIPLFLKAKGQVTGVVIASANRDKADGLLSDIQAQLESNQRYINDFGEQYSLGSWTEGQFITKDGCGFWAIGRGQSPRGIRVAHNRPNLLLIDDIDDDEQVRNSDLIDKSTDWLRGALMGAMSIMQSRMIMLGNRIAKYSILAKIVGDVNEDDKVNKKIFHCKVYALENPKTHKEDQSETGQPAWPRYTRSHITNRMEVMGYRMAQREFFHRQITEGKVFKPEWLIYKTLPKISDFEAIVTYNDPSFKDSKKNDFKAIVAVGKIGSTWWLIDCWVRQATRQAMVQAHYDMGEKLEAGNPKILKHYIEANFTQDSLIEDYVTEAAFRNYMLAINADMRSKPNKQGRIENMSVIFERGMVMINRAIKDSTDYINFKDQLLGFPNAHDDAPDAFEGGTWQLRTITRTNQAPQSGPRERRNQF